MVHKTSHTHPSQKSGDRGSTATSSAACLMRQLCSELKMGTLPLNHYNNGEIAAAPEVLLDSFPSTNLPASPLTGTCIKSGGVASSPFDGLEQRIAALETASKTMRAFGTESKNKSNHHNHSSDQQQQPSPRQQSEQQQQQHLQRGGVGKGGGNGWTYADALGSRLQSLEARIEHGVQRPLLQHLCAGRVVTLTAPVAPVSARGKCENHDAMDDDNYYKHHIVGPTTSSSSSSITEGGGITANNRASSSSVLVALSRAYVDRIQAAMDVAIAGDIIIVRAPPIDHAQDEYAQIVMKEKQTTTTTTTTTTNSAHTTGRVVVGGLVLAHPLRFPKKAGVRVVSGVPLSAAAEPTDDRVHCVDHQQSSYLPRMLAAEGGGEGCGGRSATEGAHASSTGTTRNQDMHHNPHHAAPFATTLALSSSLSPPPLVGSWQGPEADRLATAAAMAAAAEEVTEAQQHHQQGHAKKKKRNTATTVVGTSTNEYNSSHESYVHALLQTWWGLRINSNNNNDGRCSSSSIVHESTCSTYCQGRSFSHASDNVPVIVFNTPTNTCSTTTTTIAGTTPTTPTTNTTSATTATPTTSPSGLVGFVIAQASHDAPAVVIYAETAGPAAATATMAATAVHLVDCLVISSNSHAIHILQKQQEQSPNRNRCSGDDKKDSTSHASSTTTCSSVCSSVLIDGCLLHSRYGHGVACGGLLSNSGGGSSSSCPYFVSSVIPVRIQNTSAVGCGDCGFFLAAPSASDHHSQPSILVAEAKNHETLRQQPLEVHLHRCRVLESGADGIHFSDGQQPAPAAPPPAANLLVSTATSTQTRGGASPNKGRRSNFPRHMRKFGKPNHQINNDRTSNTTDYQEEVEAMGAAVTAAAVEHAVTECMIEGAARCGIFIGAYRHLAAMALTTVRIRTETKDKARNIHQKGDHGNGGDAATTTTNVAARTGSSSSSTAVVPVGVGVYVHETATIREGGREAVLITYD